MPAFPTITAATPFNDAAILDAVISGLDERWRAAGCPGDGPRHRWLFMHQAGAPGTGDAHEDYGQIAGDGTAGPYICRPIVYPPVLRGTLSIDAEDGSGNILQSLTDDEHGNLFDRPGATWRGRWSADAIYAPDDVVDHPMGYYAALAGVQGIEPGVTDGWEESWETCGAGEIDYNTGCARFTFAEAVPSYNPIYARYTSDWNAAYEFYGDATGEHAGDIVSTKGQPLDAAFWAGLQNCLIATVPGFLNSHGHASGFEGEAALEYFAIDQADFLAAAGLTHFPRRAAGDTPADPMDPDDPAFTYGVCQAGDVL